MRNNGLRSAMILILICIISNLQQVLAVAHCLTLLTKTSNVINKNKFNEKNVIFCHHVHLKEKSKRVGEGGTKLLPSPTLRTNF